MLGFLILIVVVAISFAAGYGTREAVSRKRRAHYLKWEPYTRSSRRPAQPPAFLVQQPQNRGLRSVDGGRVASGQRQAGAR